MLRWLLGQTAKGLEVAARPLADATVKEMPLAPMLCYPLQQAKTGRLIPLVKVGDQVQKWQPIAQGLAPELFTIKAGSSGEVVAIKPLPVINAGPKQVLAIHIASDGLDAAQHLSPPHQNEPLTAVLAKAGILGLGGAGFPSQRKWLHSQATDHQCHTLIVNAVECEPYVQCDFGLLSSNSEQIMQELAWLKTRLGIPRVVLALKDTQETLLTTLQALAHSYPITIATVPDRYPNGAERKLIELVTGKLIPLGQRPIDLGIVTQNIATVLAIATAWRTGTPLTSRIITFAGLGIKKPGNYLVRLGTPLEFCLQQVGFMPEQTVQLSEGGHIMSLPIHDFKAPVQASTNCVLALDASEITSTNFACLPSPLTPLPEGEGNNTTGILRQSKYGHDLEQPCIRCGACAEVCPEYLLPQQLHWFSRIQDNSKLIHYHLERCIECGCCDAVCPSHIPLRANFAQAKRLLASEQQANIAAQYAKERYNAKEIRNQERELALAAKRAAKKREVASEHAPAGAADPAMTAKKNAKQQAIAEAVARAQAKQVMNE